MKITIHQPEHMPWAGFFQKVYMADIYVVLENVQYRRRYFQNRNKIRTKDGWQWVTVPVEKDDRDELLIKDVLISKEDRKWKRENLGRIYHGYCKAPYFKPYWDDFKNIYAKDHQYLGEFNKGLLRFFFGVLGLNKKIVSSSELNVSSKKGDLIFDICKTLGADTYISGISGKDYLDIQKFKDQNIEVVMQEFHHPIYEQQFDPFVPCMSIIDLLFNCGGRSLDIINGVNVPVMSELFL